MGKVAKQTASVSTAGNDFRLAASAKDIGLVPVRPKDEELSSHSCLKNFLWTRCVVGVRQCAKSLFHCTSETFFGIRA